MENSKRPVKLFANTPYSSATRVHDGQAALDEFLKFIAVAKTQPSEWSPLKWLKTAIGYGLFVESYYDMDEFLADIQTPSWKPDADKMDKEGIVLPKYSLWGKTLLFFADKEQEFIGQIVFNTRSYIPRFNWTPETMTRVDGLSKYGNNFSSIYLP